MKIIVINNTTATKIPCVDGHTCVPGETYEMTGRSKDEVVYMMQNVDENDVIIKSEIEGDDRAPIISKIKTPADPGSGVGTQAANGFDLETEAGAAANVAPQMYLGVFDDEELTTPAANATLDTAAAGTIDAGAGTNLLTVTPSAAGEVSVTLTDAEDETVYTTAWPVGTSYIIECTEYHTTPFIP